MEYKNLTPKVKIPVLGLGTWRMGGGLRADYSQDKDHIEALKYAISLGITHIDTAEIYGAGHAEELVGEAIKGMDRKKLFITTKISPQNIFTQGQIRRHAEASLKRLQTDYIDLYLIHWPNPLVQMKNVMATFDNLVLEGLVRFIGVSNFSVRQLQSTQNYSENKIITNQVEYSLLCRDPERELLPFCQPARHRLSPQALAGGKEGVILTAYTPLANGKLTQKGYYALDKVSKKYKKTPAQVALRWLIEKSQVIVIPKSSSKEHIREIAGTIGWKLEKEDQEYLDGEF